MTNQASGAFQMPAFWTPPETESHRPKLFRVSPPKSKYLLVVNKGKGSVELKREGDKWDLLEIYFMPSMIEEIQRNPSLTDAEHVVFETDRKWRKFRIMKAVCGMADFWNSYDAIMLADDDLEPVGCTISEMFDLFMQTGRRIGQPALTQDSYYSHPITIRNSNFIWRKTNFVEIMCPIFRREGLEGYMPLFDETCTNFGLDLYWGYHETESGIGLAILDRTPMRHVRPIGGGVAYEGLENPQEEYESFMRRHGLVEFSHLCLGGIADERFSDETRFKDYLKFALAISGYDKKLLQQSGFGKYLSGEISAMLQKK